MGCCFGKETRLYDPEEEARSANARQLAAQRAEERARAFEDKSKPKKKPMAASMAGNPNADRRGEQIQRDWMS